MEKLLEILTFMHATNILIINNRPGFVLYTENPRYTGTIHALMELFIDIVQYTKKHKGRYCPANGRVDLETEEFPKGNVWKISKEWSGYESSSLTVNCIGVGQVWRTSF